MDDKESLLRFERQIRFIVEMDRLKLVLRRTLLTDESRLENSAEHSWHVTLMAILLREHADAGVDVDRVVRMLLVHDLVEIDAGDTFAYDAAANVDKAEREALAADRIFGLLPEDQAEELRALWEEFEAGTTIDSRYAVALDRLQPLLQNVHARGGAWRTHGITQTQVLERMRPVAAATPGLWSFVEHTIETVWAKGFIREIDPTYNG
jgi:putative hydrolase of HD superfamily